MLKVSLWAIAAFIVFSCLGFYVGHKNASQKEYISAYITKHSVVELKDQRLTLRYTGETNIEYWTYDLDANKGLFEEPSALENAQKNSTLSAESEMLLKFLGGGAVLSYSANDIFKYFSDQKTTTDWRIRLATIIGGITGFSVGYWLGIESIGNDSPEIASFLKNEKNIENIKARVFLSMLSKDSIRFHASEITVDTPYCEKNIQKSICIMGASHLNQDNKTNLKASIAKDAKVKLSDDSKQLEGYEFIIFFI